MQWSSLPPSAVTVDANVHDATVQSSSRRVVSLEDPGAGTDKWVYYFYINSSQHLGYIKSTDNGATFGAFQTIDSVPATYLSVSVYYDRWTKGGSGNLIHIAAVNTTDQGIRYFQLDTNNTDTIAGDIVALSSTTVSTIPSASICISWDGTVYVACVFTSTSSVRMANSSSPTSSWNDRGAVTTTSSSTSGIHLVPAKTDNDVMMGFRLSASDAFHLVRWDAIGNSWLTIDSTAMTADAGYTYSMVHDPVTGDCYVANRKKPNGTITTVATIEVLFFDESADTFTQRGEQNFMSLTGSSILDNCSISMDTNNNTLFIVFMTGITATALPCIWISHDGGVSLSDPQRVALVTFVDDFRYPSLGYHVIDESLGLHLGWFNDDLNDALYSQLGIDRITGNVVDDSGTAASGVDALIFSVDPNGSLMGRAYQGRAISDGSGDWAASVLDIADDNVEIQIIYDENLTNDEVDASHRIPVNSF